MSSQDFLECARAFTREKLSCSYASSVKMDDRLGDNPSERKFIVTFSRPTEDHPAPVAVAHVYITVLVIEGRYVVVSYQVEGRRQVLDPDTPFNEVWLDELIRRKSSLRGLIDLYDDFTDTRILEEDEDM
mmetsp:Transcript_3259/g.4601  ORF Transcript_3259/g.4601 Transcript_3259/m.4601 type:complete len:130 (+) Transcript_3259:191-580(+)